MSTRLVILGLLRDRQMYGYEIKQTIERHMGDWTNIAFGSIYFALGKMEEEGHVEKLREEREGGRPSRSIYRTTEAGKREFLRLLRQTWADPQRQYFTVDVGLFFAYALPKEELMGYIDRRLAVVDQALEHLRTHRGEQMGQVEVPPVAAAIFDHTRVHLEAEREWLQSLRTGVLDGSYRTGSGAARAEP